MKEVPLGNGLTAKVHDEDYEWLSRYSGMPTTIRSEAYRRDGLRHCVDFLDNQLPDSCSWYFSD
jgi:hypothetical protein